MNTEHKSRTEYSARNTTVAIIARVIAILLGFATRVVFTRTLSEDYVGINGLFTDILNVLALSELGVGTAITYALYKPVAEQNIEKQKALMRLYRKLYRVVALIVLAAGLLLIPFMDLLVKGQPAVESLTLIYLLYLGNSVISYLLIYKRSLIDAHQMSYIGVVNNTLFLVIQNVLQMIILLFTGDFLLFVIVMLLCTLFNNICISKKAERLYPYLKEKQTESLPTEERQGIYRNIKAMLMHKLGDVSVNNTDNLLLSSMVGIVSVAIYSNYFLIIGSVHQVLNQAFQGITASVGNLGVEEDSKRVKQIFETSFFIGQWMYGFAAICLYELLPGFVTMSFGENYLFSDGITLVLCLNFYLLGMRQPTLVFRNSLGIFWFDRYKSIAEAAVNLVVSLILGYLMGTIGIFIGTMISTITTCLWVEPYMLYKHRLHLSVKPYFLRYLLYATVTVLLWAGVDVLCSLVPEGKLVFWLLRLVVCIILPNAFYLLVYHRTAEWRFLYNVLMRLFHRRTEEKC